MLACTLHAQLITKRYVRSHQAGSIIGNRWIDEVITVKRCECRSEISDWIGTPCLIIPTRFSLSRRNHAFMKTGKAFTHHAHMIQLQWLVGWTA